MEQEKARVLLIASHDPVRRGLQALLQEHNIVVIGAASTMRDGVELAVELQPQVVVIDLCPLIKLRSRLRARFGIGYRARGFSFSCLMPPRRKPALQSWRALQPTC
jgi:DNA-binding NarL/FixJ family response regulator